jgi:hypothetical protein
MKEMLYSRFTFHIGITIFKYFLYTILICCTSQQLFRFEAYLWRVYMFLMKPNIYSQNILTYQQNYMNMFEQFKLRYLKISKCTL